MVFYGVEKAQLLPVVALIQTAMLELAGDLWTWEADPGHILLSAKEFSWREIG